MTDAVRTDAGRPERPPKNPGTTGMARPGGPADRRVFVLDREDWTALSGLLELPVRDVAGLRALLSNATVLG